MAAEFDLIERFFNRSGLAASPSAQVALGIGDDCALLSLPPGHQMAVSMDVLVEGVHFPAGAPAALVAQRALRVNLSDLAAMGAEVMGFTLGLTLPEYDEAWLQAFSDGLLACSREFRCPLLGGNTTRGPLNIAIQVHGSLVGRRCLTRSGARPGDRVYVSGALGAGAAVEVVTGRRQVTEAQRTALENLYYLPEPRLDLGLALRDIATACLDISDGLLGDLGHLARASQVQIQVEASHVPVLKPTAEVLDSSAALEMALTGGDDYELVFTVPVGKERRLAAITQALDMPLACIGKVVTGRDAELPVLCLDQQAKVMQFNQAGFRHFNDE